MRRRLSGRLQRQRHDLSYFGGGIFLSNAVPHYASGMMGRAFQSPFANPRGKGLSSSKLNVVWGFFNLAVGYLLVLHVGSFDPRSGDQAASLGLGLLLMGLYCANHFGQFHGGNAPLGANAPEVL